MTQVNTVHKLTLDIMDLVAGYEERNSLFIHIFNICSQIQSAIAPLIVVDHQTINHNTQTCLHSLTSLLSLTYNHLEMWTHRRNHHLVSLYNPWLLAHKLKVHKRQLLEHYITLMASLQVVDRIRGYNFVSPAVSVSLYNPWLLAHKLKVHKRQLLEHYITLMASLQVVDRIRGYNFVSPAVSVYSLQERGGLLHKRTSDHVPVFPCSEAKTFWNRYFKGQPDFVDASRFRQALSQWLGKELDDNSYRRSLLRLDHDDEKTVRFSAFYGLVKHGRMADIINSYLSGKFFRFVHDQKSDKNITDPRLPLLVWIDDAVEENSPRVFEAITHGVTVVQLASINSAKTWLSANHEFLLRNDDPASIRFIAKQSSNGTDEHGKPFVNHNAGHGILQYIRQQGIRSAPVLILSSLKDIGSTVYVQDDRMAGSALSTSPVYADYVSALGSRTRDDDSWKTFNAV